MYRKKKLDKIDFKCQFCNKIFSNIKNKNNISNLENINNAPILH